MEKIGPKDVQTVNSLADSLGYRPCVVDALNRIGSFIRSTSGAPSNATVQEIYATDHVIVNIYYITSTVQTCLFHPGQNRNTQLFRPNVTLGELQEILENPRVHTGKGKHRVRKNNNFDKDGSDTGSDSSLPRIIHVPDDYSSLSEALEAAPSGASIHMGKGHYEEYRFNITKPVTIEVDDSAVLMPLDEPFSTKERDISPLAGTDQGSLQGPPVNEEFNIFKPDDSAVIMSFFPTSPISPIPLELPKRPSVGTLGRLTRVKVNFYEFNKEPKGLFYHYECSIECDSMDIPLIKTMIMRQYLEKVLENKIRFVYDGGFNVYSAVELPQDKQSSEVILTLSGHRSIVNKVALRLITAIPSEPFYAFLNGTSPGNTKQASEIATFISILNITLRQGPSRWYIPLRKMVYFPNEAVALSNGLQALLGGFQRARLGGVGKDGKLTHKLLVRLNMKYTVFYKPINLVESMAEIFRHPPNVFQQSKGLNEQQTKDMAKHYCGVKIECIHLKHRPCYEIFGFTTETADLVKHKDKVTGEEISIKDYYFKQYNYDLAYGTCLPCVIVECEITLHIPIEVCRILEHQPYYRQPYPSVQAEFNKIAVANPVDRKRTMQKLVQLLDYQNHPDLKAFAMQADTDQMLTVDTRILSEPTLIYDPASKQEKITPKLGAWNLVGQKNFWRSACFISVRSSTCSVIYTLKVPAGAKLQAWAITVFGTESMMPTPVISNFVKELVNICQTKGMNVANKNPQIIRGSPHGDPDATLNKAYSFASYRDLANNQTVPPQLILCIFNQSRTLYDPCKLWGDYKQGVMTQCVIYRHVIHPAVQYCTNLFLKINAKLGGKNAILDQDLGSWDAGSWDAGNASCMIIGVHVTHFPPYSSIAAMVATIDSSYVRYIEESRLQPSRTEVIQDFGGMLESLLNRFILITGKEPRKILVYRGGVGEDMLEIVKRYEIDEIKKTCLEYRPNYVPIVTFVMVQKSRHTHFFPANDNDMNCSGNCVPGTVVDTVITHPYEYDFFLQSHASTQGTSRPSHYKVLYDEYGFKPDELQLLTYHLCYTNVRCTRAVSVVPPVTYAALCAYRLKLHFADIASGSEDSERSTDTDNNVVLKLTSVNANIKGEMWWI